MCLESKCSFCEVQVAVLCGVKDTRCILRSEARIQNEIMGNNRENEPKTSIKVHSTQIKMKLVAELSSLILKFCFDSHIIELS